MVNKSIRETFIVGDEWLYYKIYCGVNTADKILLDIIDPFCSQLLETKMIDKWFFIRYRDSDPHLRIRFHLTNLENLSEIIIKLKTLIAPYLVDKEIWDITLTTYKRELERYGENTIVNSESLFFYDSQQVISIIKNSKDDVARFLCVFKWIEDLILLFKINTQQQLAFLKNRQTQFKEEFNIKKIVTKELNLKYKKLENTLFSNKIDNEIIDIKHKEVINNILELHKQQLLQISIENLLASYIHMTINRSFKSKQRLYEMMIYDFLYKKNKTKFIRHGKL